MTFAGVKALKGHLQINIGIATKKEPIFAQHVDRPYLVLKTNMILAPDGPASKSRLEK